MIKIEREKIYKFCVYSRSIDSKILLDQSFSMSVVLFLNYLNSSRNSVNILEHPAFDKKNAHVIGKVFRVNFDKFHHTIILYDDKNLKFTRE